MVGLHICLSCYKVPCTTLYRLYSQHHLILPTKTIDRIPNLGNTTKLFIQQAGLKINGKLSNDDKVLFGLDERNSPIVLKKVELSGRTSSLTNLISKLFTESQVYEEISSACNNQAIVKGRVEQYETRYFIIMNKYAGTIQQYISLKSAMDSATLLQQGIRIKVLLLTECMFRFT